MTSEEIEARYQKRLKEIDEWYYRSLAIIERKERLIGEFDGFLWYMTVVIWLLAILLAISSVFHLS